MARRVFFSFHYEADVFRAMQVRQSWVTQGGQAEAGYFDHAEFESVKRQGDAAIKRWIDGQLVGASVTCVLIGEHTATRPWVLYEIQRSAELGKGLLGVRIHDLRCVRDHPLRIPRLGLNPFEQVEDPSGALLGRSLLGGLSIRRTLANRVPIYSWTGQAGFLNFRTWVEEAARAAGR